MATWTTEFQTVVLEALRKQPVPEMAMGIEGLTQEVGQSKLHEAEFMLANDIKPPEQVEHITCKKKKRPESKPKPVEADGWICSARKGSAVHRNCGGKPACQKKRRLSKAHFKGKVQELRTQQEAEALAAMNMGNVCQLCAALEERNKAFVLSSLKGAGGGGWGTPPASALYC